MTGHSQINCVDGIPAVWKAAADTGKFDVSCCIHSSTYKLGIEDSYRIFNEGRLGHSHSLARPAKPCFRFNETDIVECYYLFGDTLLISQHPYGQCPWKLMWKEGD